MTLARGQLREDLRRMLCVTASNLGAAEIRRVDPFGDRCQPAPRQTSRQSSVMETCSRKLMAPSDHSCIPPEWCASRTSRLEPRASSSGPNDSRCEPPRRAHRCGSSVEFDDEALLCAFDYLDDSARQRAQRECLPVPWRQFENHRAGRNDLALTAKFIDKGLAHRCDYARQLDFASREQRIAANKAPRDANERIARDVGARFK